MVGRLVKISPYRTGEPRFGTREHKPFDNSVKTYKLSPEELAKYRGENVKEKEKKGANKMAVAEEKIKKNRPGRPKDSGVVTVKEYVDLSLQGLLDKEIADKKGIHPSSLAGWKTRNKQLIDEEKAKRVNPSNTEVIAKSKYDELLKENKELKDKLQSVTEEKEGTFKKYNQLYDENAELRKRLSEQEKKEDSNASELSFNYEYVYRELSKDYERLVHECEEAEAKVEELQEEKRLMEVKIVNLGRDLQHAEDKVEHYIEAYKEFKDEFRALQTLSLTYLKKEAETGA